MKALFCRIDFNYTTNFVKKCFLFFSIFFFCEKYILNSILLQNFHFYVIIFAFKAFFPSFFKVDIHSTNVSCATDPIRWPSFFFQSYRLEELINTLLTKCFTDISDSLYTLPISVMEFTDEECLDLFTYFQRCLVVILHSAFLI